MRKLKNEELQRISIDTYAETKKTPIVVILDNVRSANNVGSVFRTSDAFLIEKVLLCGISATPPNKDIHKTALGAQDSVPWEYFQTTLDAINSLRQNNYTIIAIEQVENSTMLQNFSVVHNQKLAVVFGNEVNGVEQSIVDICDQCIEIPQMGTKHSLNISVSCGVVLWELFKKIQLTE